MRTVFVLVLSYGCGGMGGRRFERDVVLGGETVQAGVLERGSRVYALRCARCHGARGDGRGPSARTLAVRPADLTLGRYPRTRPDGGLPSDRELATRILRGVPERGMPAFEHLSPEDLEAVTQYIKWLAPAYHGAASGTDQAGATG